MIGTDWLSILAKRSRSFFDGTPKDVSLPSFLVSSSLFVFALLVRIPYLLTVPGFKSNELEVTMALVRGERFPLYNQHPHIGALANYINASAFWIFGLYYWIPSLIILVMGSLTVALLYPLGKRLLGPASAFLAALMLAGSFYHVFELSHLAWSNSMTPFFVVCFLLSLMIGLQENKSFWLIFSGFLFGLALQTHPSVITLFPAVLCIVLLQGKDRILKWLKKPAPYLAIVAALSGYGNMLYYNLMSRFGSIHGAMTYPTYALEQHPGAFSYIQNTEGAWLLLLRLVSGAAEDQDSLLSYWKNPFLVLCAAGLGAGIILCIKRKKWEMVALLGSPILLIPILNQGYDLCKFGRYLGFLIPIAYLLIAYASVELFRFIRSRSESVGRILPIFGIALTFAFFMHHQNELSKTYIELQRQDQTMHAFQQIRSILLKDYERKTSLILIDSKAWESVRLEVFLETDGWKVTDLQHGSYKNNRSSKWIRLEKIDSKIQEYWQNAQNSKVVALIAPLTLKTFMKEAPVVSCTGCLAKGPMRGNAMSMILNNIYYAFELGPTPVRFDDHPTPLLRMLQRIAPYLPDKIDLRDRRSIQDVVLPVGIKMSEMRLYLKQVCTPGYVQLPAEKCRICSANIGGTPIDKQNRQWARKKRIKK